ncbi:MAG: methyltransferase family protein [Nitrospirota bacterium]
MTINWTVAIAFVSFAFLHSLTVSRVFKSLLSRIIGETAMRAYYRLAFTAFSAIITGAAFYAIIIQPDTILFRPPEYISVPARIIQVLGFLIFLAALKPFHAGSFSGLRQAMNYLREGSTSGDIEGIDNAGLITSGVYGLVRHPMYLAGILIFLFEPVITVNNLELRLLATAYFLFGMFIEERRFLQDFGGLYVDYRQKVPMFNVVAGIAKKFY